MRYLSRLPLKTSIYVRLQRQLSLISLNEVSINNMELLSQKKRFCLHRKEIWIPTGVVTCEIQSGGALMRYLAMSSQDILTSSNHFTSRRDSYFGVLIILKFIATVLLSAISFTIPHIRVSAQ